ncbi:MAG: 4-hydroxy-tetrahydrodipicolinate synthase [uncultured Solirubrobacterales bacterium]|uniref:4-hydroxy-tetrahydrodipicolinate synthase n=1 Tax=uncultured Solirubrobacterales bacterium TaxID=768556 RepID=A0A6J4SQZ9_9ACTN|nr:MAG: 4-hydroxy-tetrahydrodipicolinate synthase [uncultured Solirubrobacterales bacterium]
MDLGGILTAMVTPFDEQGRVAEDEAVGLMRHLVDHGSDGLVLAGTTGESPTLDDEEKLRLWTLAVEELGGRATVIAGSGSNDTAHSVRLTERASAVGVDAVLVVTPYYNKPNRRGLLAHFRAVAGATDLPVIVYNIPSRSVIDLPNDLLRELAEIPNVQAVKQARSDDLDPIEGMDLLAGNDEMLAEVLEMGGTGGILVASHLVGEEMRRMIDEPDRRGEIADSIEQVVRALNTVAPAPATVKAALDLLGHHMGSPRLPLVPASDDEVGSIRAALETHGLLSRV